MRTIGKRTRKSSFFGHSFVLRKKVSFRGFLSFITIAVLFFVSSYPQLFCCFFNTNFLLSCVQTTAPSLSNINFSFSTKPIYGLLHSTLPVIPANESMAKKYAAQTDTSIRLIRQVPLKQGPSEAPSTPIKTVDMSAKGITFSNATEYQVNAKDLLSFPLSFAGNTNKPRVLIVHTHTSEAYSDSPGGRNKSEEKNVVRIGKVLAERLNRAGIITIHDTNKNDEPEYNGSYKKALGVIEKNLAHYPSLEIVLDIHRDYTVRDSGKPTEQALKPTQTENGKNAAQVMFVIGTDAMGLSHPDWKHNLAFSVQLQNILNQKHPGLCRPINLRTERFNQHMTKGSMIIEVGSSFNTLEEAVRAADYISEALIALLSS